ncbi:MAG: phosphate/phosphite/phosphonate ABC transporter substrate-binding protein [Candidatus Eisenbacteria bacterium]|nr:phosphate/phosphite/phosphonate ABC transporter substrate-binding protein [Candidatus Eisenbacteria bacterium]
MRRLPIPLSLVLSLGILAALPLDAKEKTTVRLGFYPSHNREQLSILAKEFCSYMSEKTGYDFEPVVSRDYEDLINGITKNEVHFAWLSPLSFVKAEQKKNARVLLKSVRGANPFYWGAIIVRKGSGIESLADLRGKRMGWTYPSSTAGYIFTKAALHAEGIDTDTYFASNSFIGGYDELVRAVVDGVVDAGAVFANDTENQRGAWTQYLNAKERRLVKAIFYTKPIPGDTITGSKVYIEENPKVTNKVLEILLRMGEDEKGRKLLTDLYQVDYLVDAESGDYESVREASLLFPDRR